MSKPPTTAIEIYRMLPEGTRCEVIFNELIFQERRADRRYKVIPEVPESALDVYRMLPKGTRCEVIFNELIMSSAETSPHQLLLSELNALLHFFLKDTGLGKVIPAPIDVYLENYDSVIQPDLAILINENLHKIKTGGIYGAPDIAIEIISQNRTYDTQRKRALYEKAGVKEYFMIDPENKNIILLTLNAFGTYDQTYEETGVFNSAILNCSIPF